MMFELGNPLSHSAIVNQMRHQQYRAGLLTIAAINCEELLQFYAQLLGQEPQPYIPNIYGEFQLPGLRLGIFKPKQTHLGEFAPIAGRAGAMSLCLEVGDLEAAITHITALGYPPTDPIEIAAHGREIYARDPVGNRLILYEPSLLP